MGRLFAFSALWPFRLSVMNVARNVFDRMTTKMVLILAVIALSSSSANSAYFDVVAENINHLNNPLNDMWFEPRCNIEMTGKFDSTTVNDFEQAVQELNAKSQLKNDFISLEKSPGFRALCMSSSGGDLHAALDLIPHIDRWIAVVPDGWVCQSACAIAFMGAGLHAGPYGDFGVLSTNRRQSRFLHYRGILSFHAPTLELTGGTFTEEQVLDEYDRSRLTVGRILFRQGWDDLVARQASGAAAPDLSTLSTIEQMLSTAETDPFLPASLFFTFLVTPNKSAFEIRTVEQALVWGVQIYGLARKELSKNIPEFWIWQACANLTWMTCHNPYQLSNGCNTIGVSREIFSDQSTLPYLVEQSERSGIERFTSRLGGSASTIERIALGNNYQKSGRAYGGGPETAQCGISIYTNQNVTGIRGEYHPSSTAWAPGKLSSSVADDEERRWLSASKIPPETDPVKIIRPWMLLPMNSRLTELNDNWTALYNLASADAALLRGGSYRVLQICNFTRVPLRVALGYESGNALMIKGWYEVAGVDCFVPVGIHSGDAFFVYARDAIGREYSAQGQVGRNELCIEGTEPLTLERAVSRPCVAKNVGQVASKSFTALRFSKIKARRVVTPVIFGTLPPKTRISGFSRAQFRDVQQRRYP